MMDNIRKTPRAPGLNFADILKAYDKHPIPDYLLIDKSEWLGDKDIPCLLYTSDAADE